MAKQKYRQEERISSENPSGLVLDDYLGAIADVRKRFKLTRPAFRLRELESYPRAMGTVEKIVELMIRRHGASISTKPHPLLADLGEEIYAERVVTGVYSGYRIQADHSKDVLRRTIEIGLQTITQLPPRHPPAPSPRKLLKSLAGAFARAAGVTSIGMRREEVRKRIELFFGSQTEARQRLFRAFDELGWCAETLEGISSLKVRKLSLDSRKPQVSLALYVVNWLEASTGSKQYGAFTTLLEGAFEAAKRSTPRWVGRLAIEMHARRRRREEWMARISSGASPAEY